MPKSSLPRISEANCQTLLEAKEYGRLVEHHLYLPPVMARVNRKYFVEQEDLIAEGNLALVASSYTYCPQKMPFKIHARWCIQESIWAYVAQLRLIKVSSYSRTLLNDLIHLMGVVLREQGKKASTAMLKTRLQERSQGHLSPETVQGIVHLAQQGTVYLDDSDESNEASLGDLGLCTEGNVVEKEVLARHELQRALGKLDDLQRQVIVLRYGLEGQEEHSRGEVANKLQLKPQQVLRVETMAMDVMRR